LLNAWSTDIADVCQDRIAFADRLQKCKVLNQTFSMYLSEHQSVEVGIEDFLVQLEQPLPQAARHCLLHFFALA